MAKFDVSVELVGRDGNAFAILGRVDGALRRAGATDEERHQFFEEATSGDYGHLLRTVMEWVEVGEPEDDDEEWEY